MHIYNQENLDVLTDACVAGDRVAQNRLYKQFAPKMLGVCFRYSKSRQEAEDTLLEGFMKVFENLRQFRKAGSLEGWIRRIMVNTALEKYRKNQKERQVIPIDDVREIEAGREEILSEIGAKELNRMIQKLPSGYRMVFNLYVFEGLKHREIAAELGISEGTSKSNLFDARAILQREVLKSTRIAKVLSY
jgi:RNA polymerase sigma factor (sigma-70 family)